MTKIQFTRDFRSAATGEQAYAAGSVGQFSEENAAAIIGEGAAVPAAAGAKVDQPVPDAPSHAERRRARDRFFWLGGERGRWR